MNLLSDEEVFKPEPKLMSDEEVFKPQQKLMSDDEVFAAPKAATPSAAAPTSAAPAPPSAGTEEEQPVQPIARPPLPRPRPEGAPERQPGFVQGIGESFQRGFHSMRQQGDVALLGASARPLNNLTAIEDRLAKGESPDAIPDNEDLFGARYMTSEQRASLRAELQSGVKSAAQGVAERQADINRIPADPDVARLVGANTFGEAWEAFKKAPVKIIANLGAESALASAPGMVGAAVAGPVGGIAAAATAAGAGSYGVDYLSSILDAMRDAGVDLNDPAEIEAAVGNPEFLDQIGKKAHAHAVVVGALDAAAMKAAEVSLLPKVIRPSNRIVEKVAELPVQAQVQGGLGAAGEFGGQVAAGDEIQPGQIVAEYLGEHSTAPVEVATAMLSKGHPTGAPTADMTGPITSDEIAAHVAAGNVPGVAPPVNDPTMPEPTAPPAAPGEMTATRVGDQVVAVPTDPNAAPGTVPTTLVQTSEPDVTTTVSVTPGTALDTTERAEAEAAPEAQAKMVPVEGFYSRLRAWVQEVGPARATAQRWASLLSRGDFTREELNDLKVHSFLYNAGPRERLTREDVLAHLDQNAISLHEVVRTPLTEEARIAKETAIFTQMAQVARADPSAIRPGGGAGLTRYNENHPAMRPLFDQYEALLNDSNWTSYEAYTTPGPRQAYAELTMATPTRLSAPTPHTPVEPKGEIIHEPDTHRQYPFRVMVNGEEFNRTSNRETAEVELQSGLRQARRRQERAAPREYVGGHFQVPGEIVTIRVTVRETIDGQLIALLEEVQGDIQQKAERVGVNRPDLAGYVPDLPLKEGWPALAFSRFLMWAAERGIRHVAWADADEQMRRYPKGTPDEVHRRRAGMQTFYNREILSIAKRWARKFGGTIGYETIQQQQYIARPRNPANPAAGWMVVKAATPNMRALITTNTQQEAQEYIDRQMGPPVRFRAMIIPQTGLDYIAAGMPTHAKEETPHVGTVTVAAADPNVSPLQVAAVQPLGEALLELIRQLDLKVPVDVKLYEENLATTKVVREGPLKGRTYEQEQPTWMGGAVMWPAPGAPAGGRISKGSIRISVGKHKTARGIWVTMTHELGHVIERTVYVDAPRVVREAVDAAFELFLKSFGPNATLGDVYRARMNPIDLLDGTYNANNTTLLSELSPTDRAYQLAKTEWFAEQVSKWASSRVKPLSIVERFFAGLGRQINQMFAAAMKKFNLPYNQAEMLHAWLDSRVAGAPEFFAQVQMETRNDGTVENSTHMSPEETAAPVQPETAVGMDGANGIFNGNPPPEIKEAKSYADKFNWLYKWALGIQHLATRNPHIASLQRYVEILRVARMTRDAIMIRAQEVYKSWNRLGELQGDAVSQMLDDVQNMSYRTANEIKNKIARLPTVTELQAIATKYGVSRAGFGVFVEITKTFQEHLDRVEAMLRAEADKITDQTKRGLSHAQIDRQMQALRSKPYFPAMRFGNYTITVRDAAGKVTHFETFENRRTRDRAMGVIQGALSAGETIQAGFLDKEVRPLLGVPTSLLNMMADKLKLSSLQRDALEQLKFELSPAQSFQHRFQHKKRIAGYSQDFRRAYASYFFHGANHITKALYADTLRALTKAAADETKNWTDVTKRDKIVAYMTDHTSEWLDPKSDWAAIRSVAFLWHLAFSPMSAAQNLTQTLATSYPFLASQFGDIKAVAALANAGRKFSTFYRKGTLENMTGFEQQAIWRGMEYGVIKETQAPELAGYADGDVLGKGFGGNALQRGFVKFNELGALMFELAEQVNRRLVFRAALQLALENPNTKYVKDMVAKHKVLYAMVRADMTEAQAAAFVTAVDATQETQFQYGREFAPRMFRGKKRALFVFQTFNLNYVLFLANYPRAAVRSLLIMGILCGFMGLPLAGDLAGWLKAIGWQLFGKDFDLEQEARRWFIQLFGENENGRENAELIMHGIARKGFGIPALLDMLGGTIGMDFPMPTFDTSSAISQGTLLPIDMGKLFGPPTQDANTIIAQQTAKASGAVFGQAFAIYQALVAHKQDIDDSKRWEKAMPRFAGSAWKAYRVWNEGGERRSDGSRSVTYDVRDTQQMAEVLGMAAGFTPYRQTLQRERDMAMQDAVKLWDIRRGDLMRQFGNAVLGKDKGEIAKVREGIMKFNQSLPPEARGKAITSDVLRESVEGKAKSRALKERELSTKKSDIPVMREVGKLYPESQRTLRKVKPSLTP